MIIQPTQSNTIGVIDSTIEDISKKERGSYKTIPRVVNRQIDTEVDWSQYTNLETIGIDEISDKKGHQDYLVIRQNQNSDKIHGSDSQLFKSRKSSGFVEGLNNKIKVMKRRCYGLGSVETYFQRLWLDLKGYAVYGI